MTLQKSRELYLNQKREKISLKSKQKTFGIFLNATVNKQRAHSDQTSKEKVVVLD